MKPTVPTHQPVPRLTFQKSTDKWLTSTSYSAYSVCSNTGKYGHILKSLIENKRGFFKKKICCSFTQYGGQKKFYFEKTLVPLGKINNCHDFISQVWILSLFLKTFIWWELWENKVYFSKNCSGVFWNNNPFLFRFHIDFTVNELFSYWQ